MNTTITAVQDERRGPVPVCIRHADRIPADQLPIRVALAGIRESIDRAFADPYVTPADRHRADPRPVCAYLETGPKHDLVERVVDLGVPRHVAVQMGWRHLCDVLADPEKTLARVARGERMRRRMAERRSS